MTSNGKYRHSITTTFISVSHKPKHVNKNNTYKYRCIDGLYLFLLNDK